MFPVIRSTSTILVLFAFCLPIFKSAWAAPIVVAPAYKYIYNNDRSHLYDTYQEAYDQINPSQSKDPGTGLVHWRVVGAKKPKFAVTQNGRLLNMEQKWQSLTYNYTTQKYDTWVDRPDAGNVIAMVPECPVNWQYQDILKSETATGRNFLTTCTGGGRPEPRCDNCGNTSPESGPPVPEPVGNPIYPSTGLKQQVEVDYQSTGPGGLAFVRTYRSDRNGWQHNYYRTGVSPLPKPFTPPDDDLFAYPFASAHCYWAIGQVTRQLRCFEVMDLGSASSFVVQRANGRILVLGGAGQNASADVKDRFEPGFDAEGNLIGDVYNAENDSVEHYNKDGQVETITARNGRVLHFEYVEFAGTRTSDTQKYQLSRVTDHFGKSLSFTYDAEGRLKSMMTPEAAVYSYAYNTLGNVTSVTYPDGKQRVYSYNEPAHTSGASLPFALTGITDENGARFATYKYTTTGEAISTEHAGGVNKYGVRFSSVSMVMDPLGVEWRYAYNTVLGTPRLASVTRPANAAADAVTASYKYDANGNVTQYVAFNGAVTTYTYDLSRNLQLTRTEAVGTQQQRMTTIEWDPKYRVPLRVAEPKRRTTYTYFANGDVKSRSIQATSDITGAQGMSAALTGKARTWAYTYNSNAQIATIVGPRTDVVDKTVYAYETSGDLQSITNAAGHVTKFAEYNQDGQVGLITQPNGVSTRITYTPRGWVDSSTTIGTDLQAIRTSYVYDNAGQIKTVTTAGSGAINYTYDDAHRLTDITDGSGNTIHYVLDNVENRTSEVVTDPNGTLARQLTRQYDQLNRLKVQMGGAQ